MVIQMSCAGCPANTESNCIFGNFTVDALDTCHFRYVATSDIRRYVGQVRTMITTAEANLHTERKRLQLLESLIETSSDEVSPVPTNRGAEYFDIGDSVAVLMDEIWQRGVVIDGYRHHDGLVHFRLQSGKTGYCGIYSGTIMRTAERDWFLTHPKAFKEWVLRGRLLPELDIKQKKRQLSWPFKKMEV